MRRMFVRVLFCGACVWGLLYPSGPAHAQGTATITGTVIDGNTGAPLPGARLTIEGTNRRVEADENGRYTLDEVPVGEITIRVRLIGFSAAGQTMTLTAGQSATADFQLVRSAVSLDEIVVTGTGREVEQRSLSATVTTINPEDIDKVPVTDVAQLLRGQVPGATINATSAQGGTSAIINFRGVSSAFSNQTPVIYVDGVRVDNNDATASGTGGEQSSALGDILAADIDHIEITKGGAASTLYGSDAATGVIQIFTKKGTPGRPTVTGRIELGADAPETRYMFDTGVIYPDEILQGADPNFLANNFFQTGFFQNYYLGATGGTSNLTYTISGRVQNNTGNQPKNETTVYNLRGSVQADVSRTLSLNFQANYVRSKFGRLYNGTAIADPLTSFEVGDVFFFTGEDNFDDALTSFLLPDIDEAVNRFWFGSGFNWRSSEVFNLRGTFGLDYRTNTQREFAPLGAVYINNGDGSVQRYQRDFGTITGDITGTISYPNTGSFTSDITFGAQGFRDNTSITNVTGQTFALPGAPDFDEAANVTATESKQEVFSGGAYLQWEIGLGNRFFVNAGARMDANTAFGDSVDTALYPKLGASYIISDEAFWRGLSGIIPTLKLRGAFGKTGKFPQPFERDRSFNAIQFRGESAPRFDNPGNTGLKPEVTSTVEFGTDLALINNRIGFGLTYFNAVTNDALFRVPEQPVTGLGTQLRNVGTVKNQGFELNIDFRIIDARDISWDIGATYATVKNRVTNLGGGAPFNITGEQIVDDGCFPDPAPCVNDITGDEGLPVGAWWVTTPIDTNGDGKNDGSERQFTGKSPLPTKAGSFNTTFRYKTLTFSSFSEFATGHQIQDFGSVWATFNGIYRREVITGTPWPIQYDLAGAPIGPYSQNQARRAVIYDGDWLKLRELAIRWDVPPRWTRYLGAGRGVLYGSWRNVAIWAANDMVDSELNGVRAGGDLNLGGRTSVTLSPPKEFRFGLELVW